MFSDILSKISDNVGFSFMVYIPDSAKMLKFKSGKSLEVEKPQAIAPHLEDEGLIVDFFQNQDNSLVIIYFLRFFLDTKKYVIVINDNKARKNLNKFFETLSKYALEGGAASSETSSAAFDNSQLESAVSECEKLKNDLNAHKTSIESREEVINELRSELDRVMKECDELRANMEYQKETINSLEFNVEELTDLVKVVRTSRDKHSALIDGLFMPTYSVSKDFTILHANSALASYVNVDNLAKVMGLKCHKVIFGLNEICPWCKMREIEQGKTNVTTEAAVEKGGKHNVLDVTSFPIFDGKGDISDYGEFIVDKTDKVELESSLNRFKEELQTFKRAKITDMNEIQDVKQAYSELSANYDILAERNKKTTRALETLMGQDAMKDLLAAKAEIGEYKNKLVRASDSIKNYQRNVEELQEKYADLNKRTFFQMERLINTINSRQGLNKDDVKSVIEKLVADFEEVKKNLKMEPKGGNKNQPT